MASALCGYVALGGVAMIVTIDWIDRLIMERECEEIVRYRVKMKRMKRIFEAHPNTTRAEQLFVARVIDAAYPTPILHAMEWDTN
jgi:hypothetical protein